jgi:hypothetical protein
MTVPTLEIMMAPAGTALVPASHTITDQVMEFSFTRGLNFEGGLSASSATLRLPNDTRQWTVTSPILAGHIIYARATYGGTVYGLFYGFVTRVHANAETRTVEVFAEGAEDRLGRNVEVAIAPSTTRSIATFRGLILDAMGVGAGQRSLTTFEAEADTPETSASNEDGQSLLRELDTSTGTLSFLDVSNSHTTGFVYTTVARNARSMAAVAESLPDAFTGLALELDSNQRVTSQRVEIADGTSTSYTASVADPALGRVGSQITGIYTVSLAAAAGLAEYIVRQSIAFDSTVGRGDVTLTNTFPTQVARKLGDKVTVTPALITAAYDAIVGTISTVISQRGSRWDTTFSLVPPGVPGTYFTLDTDELTTSASVLGY